MIELMLLAALMLHLHVASVYLGGYDYTLTHFMRGLNDNATLGILFTWFIVTADTLFMVIIIVALYLGGHRKEALVFAVVFVVTNIVTYGLKYLIARPRPSDLGITPEAEPSFPSGHTSNAFAFATTIAYYHRKAAPFLFAWALLIAFSMVFLGFHYFTDLLGGAAVGVVVSFIVTHVLKRYDAQISQFVERLPPCRRSTA
jgi:undecaprenyl-diphosphatase